MSDIIDYDAKFTKTVFAYHLTKKDLHNLTDREDNDKLSIMKETEDKDRTLKDEDDLESVADSSKSNELVCDVCN